MRNSMVRAAVGMLLLVAGILGLGVAGAGAAPVRGDLETVSLSPAQRAELQAEVDQHLKNYGGGVQIGINQVSYENGQMILTLPLPGESSARAVGAPQVMMCRFEFACLWSNTNFTGTKIERAACGTITLAAPFNSSTASIQNNQTSNTQTMILNASRAILNANLAPSQINDNGVLNRSQARFWVVC